MDTFYFIIITLLVIFLAAFLGYEAGKTDGFDFGLECGYQQAQSEYQKTTSLLVNYPNEQR